MKMKFNRGFTLIELLVVIAIIGILSSVVLASLNTARGKGANAAVKSNLNNMRAQAELFYDTGQTYTGVCSDPNVTKALTSAMSAGGATSVVITLATLQTSSTVNCHENGTVYAMAAPLKVAESGNNYWCIDSTGGAKGEAAAMLGSATSCP